VEPFETAPRSLRGVPVPTRITRDALRDRLKEPDAPRVVEALGAGYYADAHLPGALNIPPGQVDVLAPILLPELDGEIVVYCTRTCTSSEAVARRLESLGYRKLAIYEGGKEDWVEHGLPLERLDAGDAERRALTDR
jgi:rhodanese-related sulfurtransferase